MRYRFGYVRYEGTPYEPVRVDYFRDADGRCVCVRNARLEVPASAVEQRPVPVFDHIEIDGARAIGPELDRIYPKVMLALYALDWEGHAPIVGVKS